MRKQNLIAVLTILAIITAITAYCKTANATEGWELDLYSMRGGLGPEHASAPFLIGEKITLYAEVCYSEDPIESVLVSFQVNDPRDRPMIFTTARTNSDGVSNTTFAVIIPGEWTAKATTSPMQTLIDDTMTFYVSTSVGGTSQPCPYTNTNLAATLLTAIPLITLAFARKTIKRKENRC